VPAQRFAYGSYKNGHFDTRPRRAGNSDAQHIHYIDKFKVTNFPRWCRVRTSNFGKPFAISLHVVFSTGGRVAKSEGEFMLRTFSFVLILVFSASSVAQTTSAPLPPPPQLSDTAGESAVKIDEAKPQEAKVERVEVTGSHIKRMNTEGASPVQTMTRKDLEKTGYTSVSDVLRDTTMNSFGSMREASGSNAAGVAHVDLRGLGSSSTLVLLNGQRLPTDAVTGSVDLNMIPMAAVERIEVLKDGASAIYGSDALGGVVNIITRKDFSGTELSYKETIPQLEGGKKREIAIVNGINKGRMNMVNVIQYRDNEVIYSKDRDWSNKGVSTIGSPGSYRNPGGQWVADPNCPADRIVTTAAGSFCTFKYSDYSTELPALQQLSLLSETNFEISSRVRAKFRMGGTQKKAQWSFAPAPDTFTIKAGTGPALPGVDPTKDVQFRYRLTELGTRDTEVTTYSYNALLGTTVEMGKGWEVETNVSHNRVINEDVGVNGYAITSDLVRQIENGTFNPGAPEGQRGNLEGVRYRPYEEMASELSSADIKASGEFGHINGNRFGLAVGANFTFQKYKDQYDDRSVADEVFGNAGSSGGGQRDTKAVYSELVIPVTGKTEITLAGRYDKYSDFGDTVNPKAAIMYKPTKSVLIRSSAGTGFKAPLMQDLYAARSQGFPTFIDAVSCEREKKAGGPTTSCLPAQYEVTSSGNTGLKEEKSLSLGTGIVVEPTRSFNIGTDLFYTQMSNVVGIDYDDAMVAEQKLGKEHLASKGVIVHRDAQGNLESIEAPLQNLSKREVMGLDFSTNYRIWKIQLGEEWSKLFYYKQEGFPGAGYSNKLGDTGRPEWRNMASLGFIATDNHAITFGALTTPGQRKYVKSAGSTKTYTTFDMQYNWKWNKNATITAGIKNLAGSAPPLDETNPNSPLDNTIYDQIGRQYYTGLKATF
jgi:iron complex outermembrane receptor protein